MPDAGESRDFCNECRAHVRTPQTAEERQDLWTLCRHTGGRIMCPYFTADHPGNSGWEAEARRRFRNLRPLEQLP